MKAGAYTGKMPRRTRMFLYPIVETEGVPIIRLVVSDVDGTLLSDGETEIKPSVLAQIERIMKEGIEFCPTSGRQFTSLQRLFQPLSCHMYHLCENGAAIFGPGEPAPLLDKTEMDRTASIELSRQILEVPEFELVVSGVNTTYLTPKCPDLEPYIHYQLGNNTKIVSGPEKIPEEILKVSAYCRLGYKAAEECLAPAWKDRFRVAVSGANWLDFNATDKGEGLSKLCAILNIRLDEVMAFGDNDNDLSMLEMVGYPYIVENASKALKKQFSSRYGRVEQVLSLL